MHTAFLKTATATEGKGTACKVLVNHMFVWFSRARATFLTRSYSYESVDAAAGTVTFMNGVTVTADLIIGADATMVRLRTILVLNWHSNLSVRSTGYNPRHQVSPAVEG